MTAPFSPGGKTANITVGASSASAAITNQRGEVQVRVMNNGTATAWIAFGDSTVAASTSTGMPIGPGASEKFSLVTPPNSDGLYAAAIAAAATGLIYFTPGAGL